MTFLFLALDVCRQKRMIQCKNQRAVYERSSIWNLRKEEKSIKGIHPSNTGHRQYNTLSWRNLHRMCWPTTDNIPCFTFVDTNSESVLVSLFSLNSKLLLHCSILKPWSLRSAPAFCSDCLDFLADFSDTGLELIRLHQISHVGRRLYSFLLYPYPGSARPPIWPTFICD